MTRELREVVARAMFRKNLVSLGASEAFAESQANSVTLSQAWWESADAAITALWPLFAEHAAGVAQGFATCGCGGIRGRCVEDDAPLAIAAAIRAEGAPK